MNVRTCPQCGGPVEEGAVQAGGGFGILWLDDPSRRLRFVWSFFSRRVERLQADWLGFPKLSRDNLPAVRCLKCKLVVFEYSA